MAQADQVSAAAIGRLLFVDDDSGVRQAFSGVLSREGYNVDLAADGHAAIEMLKLQRYDAVITDLLMPGIDGLTLIQHLSSIDSTCSAVIITGAEELQLPDRFGDSSIVSIIAKPCGPDEFRDTVHRAVDMTKSRRNAAGKRNPATHVLLVEDDPADRRLVELYLEEASHGRYVVTSANRLEEALDLVHLEDFQIILADLSLPDARGLDSVTQLRAVAPQVPIIVLTGVQDKQIARHALALGAQDYLEKADLNAKQLERTLRYAEERKQAEMRLSFMAHYDQLTELGNRNQFNSRVAHAVARFGREERRFGVLYLDLDGFKQVNDVHGHHAGDAVLKEVGVRIRQCVREPDSVARLGGDEFAVLLENIEEPAAAAIVALRIIRALERPILHRDTELRVGASIGVAFFPENGSGVDGLLRAADAAMYRAKREGAGCYRFAGCDAHRPTPESSGDLREIERAFASGEFELFYQPQLGIGTRSLQGLEALIRWRRGPGDIVLPRELLPRLERAGIMDEIGAWGIAEAAGRLANWRRRTHRNLRVAVNLSPAQFASDHVADALHRSVEQHSLAAGALEVELTESSLLDGSVSTRERLDDCRARGIRVALDDFGKGYSSLAYLQQFTVDKLKIDRSFISQIDEQRSDSPVASCIIGLGRQLGLDVVAEGVETPEQLSFLRSQNCPTGQGFFLEVPLSTPDIERALSVD